LTFLVVSGCLAAFAVTAGVRIYMTRAAQEAGAAVRASEPAPETTESTAEVNVSSPVPTPVSSPAASVPSSASSTASLATSAQPFQVGVLDGNGRSWILWFVRGEAKSKDNPLAYRSAEASNSFAPTVRTPKRQEAALPEKQQAARTFTLAAPIVSHPQNTSAAAQSSAEAPAIQPELTPSSGNPFGGALGSQKAPTAPAAHGPIGGMVQQPRLMRTAPLVYPQLAKSTRVAGDVVVDALIDAAGNVTTVKAISGPVLLQQAAMDTVRHWKYEPARLDGQAVAMHLSVTVRFRLN
jgi:TonB family protein